MAELADALGLGPSGQPWGFESPPSHSFPVIELSLQLGARQEPVSSFYQLGGLHFIRIYNEMELLEALSVNLPTAILGDKDRSRN